MSIATTVSSVPPARPRTGSAARHVRTNTGLLAAPERVALHALAVRLPAWVQPDGLTALGLAAMLAAGTALAAAPPRWAAPLVSGCLVLNWLGDSLDGTVARLRRRERPRYGYYVDHVVDMVGTAALLAGLVLGGFLSPLIGMATLAAWLLLFAETFLATHAGGTFRLAVGWVGPTEMRVLFAAGTWWASAHGPVTLLGHAMRSLDAAAAVAGVGMVAAFAWSTVRTFRELARLDALPR